MCPPSCSWRRGSLKGWKTYFRSTSSIEWVGFVDTARCALSASRTFGRLTNIAARAGAVQVAARTAPLGADGVGDERGDRLAEGAAACFPRVEHVPAVEVAHRQALAHLRVEPHEVA